MLTIGMLGGMSWESSALYYRLANELVRDQLGGVHSASVIMHSVDFAVIEKLQAAAEWNEAGRILATAARGLETAGADLLVLCTNTMHKVAGQIEEAVTIPLVHIADATADAVIERHVGTVGLLGTAFTMEQRFYIERLEQRGVSVVVPNADDRAFVHQVIYDELVLGVIKDESRQGYREVIGRLIDAGAEGVILGCTEIELLVGTTDSAVPVFPTTRLHIEAAVRYALADAPGRDSMGA